MSGDETAGSLESRGPLEGLTVVDLTRALAGPHAGMILGDLGARVIKVEAPGKGDDTRTWGPPFVGDDVTPESTYFLSCNRNKESIALDLKNDADREVFIALLAEADALLENFRPGTLDRLGFDAARLEQINPDLITLAISGFGHDGPEGGRAGYDQIAQGEAGIMSLTGSRADDPQRVGVPIADLLAGIYGVVGVLAALIDRDRGGSRRVVRTSLLAALVGVHAFEGTRYTVAGAVGSAGGNHHPSIAPYGLFRCQGGAVQLAVGSESLWGDFCSAIGLDPNDDRFSSNAARVQNRAMLIHEIEEKLSTLSAQDALELLSRHGVPSGKVRTIDEVYEWEQTRSQGLVIEVDHRSLGPLRLPGPTLRFFDASGNERTKNAHSAPPTLDQHGAAVRTEFGVASP